MSEEIYQNSMHCHDSLINGYVRVCNNAIEQNADRFPFKQILGAVTENKVNDIIEAQVVGDEKTLTYVIKFENKQITVLPHEFCDNCACNRMWSVNISYLQDVMRHPSKYVANPAKLNWDWLYDVDTTQLPL